MWARISKRYQWFALLCSVGLLTGCSPPGVSVDSATLSAEAVGTETADAVAAMPKTADSPATHPETAESPIAAPASSAPAENEIRLEVLDFQGFENLLASQRGKVVVVDVWATYCLPCRNEFHHLVDLHKLYGSDEVACMSLSLDNEGIKPVAKVKPRVLAFLKQQGAAFDNILAAEEPEFVYDKLDLSSIPAVMVYGRDGRLVEAVTPVGDESPYVRVKQLIADQLVD